MGQGQLSGMKAMKPVMLKRKVADIGSIDPNFIRYKKNFMSQFSRELFNEARNSQTFPLEDISSLS